jgi:hypothetical protein
MGLRLEGESREKLTVHEAVMCSVWYTRPNPLDYHLSVIFLLSYVLSSTKHLFVIFPILCLKMDGSSNVTVIHEQCKFNIPQRL